MIDKNKELPKNFCSLPWLQIHTEPDGRISPCCYFSYESHHTLGNWRKDNLQDIFNNDKWNQLRKEFLQGKRPEACSRCWKEEDSGIESMRQQFNKNYKKWPDFTGQCRYDKFNDIKKFGVSDGRVGKIKLATIDLIFNNLCNFKCRTCGPGLSTSWAADAIKLGNQVPVLLTNEDIDHVKDDLINLISMVDDYTEIHFSGGEPFIQEEHYEFLKLLLDRGLTNVKIRYNTNLSAYKLKNINAFELLKNFHNVFIIGSIDAMGSKGEYIRKGFNWNQSLSWLETCKKYLPLANYAISAVYSLLNCEAAIDLHRYMHTDTTFKKPRGDQFGFYLNVLHAPHYFKTTVLPKEVKKRVTKKIQRHLKWLEKIQDNNSDYIVSIEHWNSAMIMMNSCDESHLIPEFFAETAKLDAIRNESFQLVFPELYNDLKKYGIK